MIFKNFVSSSATDLNGKPSSKKFISRDVTSRKKPRCLNGLITLYSVLLILFVGQLACSLQEREHEKERKRFEYVEPLITPVSRLDIVNLAEIDLEKFGIDKKTLKNLEEVNEGRFFEILDIVGIIGCSEHGDYLGFSKIDEVKSFYAYWTVTFKNGSTVTGKYAFMATLVQASNGGPLGTGTQRHARLLGGAVLVEKKWTKAVRKTSPRKILPGEIIIRKIAADENRIEDSYLIDFEVPYEMDLDLSVFPRICKGDENEVDEGPCLSLELKNNNGEKVYLKRTGGEIGRGFHPVAGETYHLMIYCNLKNEAYRMDGYKLVVGFGNQVGSVIDYDRWCQVHPINRSRPGAIKND